MTIPTSLMPPLSIPPVSTSRCSSSSIVGFGQVYVERTGATKAAVRREDKSIAQSEKGEKKK